MVRVSRGWEFALPYDEDFVRKHPDVARRQHMLWAGIQAKYGAAGAGRPRGVCPSRPGDAGGTGLRRGGRGGAPRPSVGPRGPPRHAASGDRRPGAGTLCSDRGWPRALELSPALSRLEKVYNLVKETTPKQPEGQSGVAGAPPPQASASGPPRPRVGRSWVVGGRLGPVRAETRFPASSVLGGVAAVSCNVGCGGGRTGPRCSWPAVRAPRPRWRQVPGRGGRARPQGGGAAGLPLGLCRSCAPLSSPMSPSRARRAGLGGPAGPGG